MDNETSSKKDTEFLSNFPNNIRQMKVLNERNPGSRDLRFICDASNIFSIHRGGHDTQAPCSEYRLGNIGLKHIDFQGIN